jgi:hypothetical protein
MMMFESKDIAVTIQRFNEGYRKILAEGIPPALGAQQFAMNTPMGKGFAVAFIWGSDDHKTGQEYATKIAALGQILMTTVAPTSVADFVQSLAAVVPPNAYGSIDTISIRKYTPEFIDIMARNCAAMPTNLGPAFAIHELRGGPSTVPKQNSVLGSREPHLMLEVISTVAEEKDMKVAREWAEAFISELRKMDSKNVLPGTYISLTPPGANSSENIYGSDYESVLRLKRVYDPEGTFGLAPPEMGTLQ